MCMHPRNIERILPKTVKGIDMEIRKSTINDLPIIMQIYNDARSFMRENGNLNQWSGNYPSESQIQSDIAEEHSYVCVEDDRILAVFYYNEGPDPTYLKIYEGFWQNDLPYGVIHRIAVAADAHGRGIAKFCFDYCYALCQNLKIDTHRDNLPMQNALLKNGFLPCGIIYLASGDERLAYQKSNSI